MLADNKGVFIPGGLSLQSLADLLELVKQMIHWADYRLYKGGRSGLLTKEIAHPCRDAGATTITPQKGRARRRLDQKGLISHLQINYKPNHLFSPPTNSVKIGIN